jgi:anti-sigma factor ChrR (cupin superfamily)
VDDDIRLNADFSSRVVIDTERAPWVASPEPGVERKPLDRIGAEIARATTIVRYAPGSAFPSHQHALGEEFLVLEGIFSDASGDYPVGTYVRNPPRSEHAPWTRDGCMIFVKLRQMHQEESERVVIDTSRAAWRPGAGEGHTVQYLHGLAPASERVTLERLDAGTGLPPVEVPGGEEIFVLSGTLADDSGTYPARTWMRNPAGYRRGLRSQVGAVYWAKRGHLPRKA